MRRHPFGSSYEAFIYPFLLVIVMWLVFWADHLFTNDFYKYGIRPKNIESLRGIFLMPLLHSKTDWAHIVNNSFPTLILLATLIFYYRSIAFRVFTFSWLFTARVKQLSLIYYLNWLSHVQIYFRAETTCFILESAQLSDVMVRLHAFFYEIRLLTYCSLKA